MLHRLGSFRLSASLLSCQYQSYRPLLSRSQSLPQKFFPALFFCPRIHGTNLVREFHRCYTYSATTFNAVKSRFPTHWDLHTRSQPSNELIRHMCRWEDELRLDAKRWTAQERDVMIAACIEFRIRYNPNKEWRVDRFKQALMAWRKGLQADAHSRRPRWNVAHRRENGIYIAGYEKEMGLGVAARTKKRCDKWKARLEGTWGNSILGALILAVFALGPFLKLLNRSIMSPEVEKREERTMARK